MVLHGRVDKLMPDCGPLALTKTDIFQPQHVARNQREDADSSQIVYISSVNLLSPVMLIINSHAEKTESFFQSIYQSISFSALHLRMLHISSV